MNLTFSLQLTHCGYSKIRCPCVGWQHTESAVQFSSLAQSCPILPPCGLQHARPPCPSPTPGVYSNTCWLVMPSNHLIFCHLLLLFPSVFPSIRVFSSKSVLHIRWPKYWRFSFSISPSNEYSGLISFRMDWFDLLTAQRILKSLLQHHCSKASILQCSAFIINWGDRRFKQFVQILMKEPISKPISQLLSFPSSFSSPLCSDITWINLLSLKWGLGDLLLCKK